MLPNKRVIQISEAFGRYFKIFSSFIDLLLVFPLVWLTLPTVFLSWYLPKEWKIPEGKNNSTCFFIIFLWVFVSLTLKPLCLFVTLSFLWVLWHQLIIITGSFCLYPVHSLALCQDVWPYELNSPVNLQFEPETLLEKALNDTLSVSVCSHNITCCRTFKAFKC